MHHMPKLSSGSNKLFSKHSGEIQARRLFRHALIYPYHKALHSRTMKVTAFTCSYVPVLYSPHGFIHININEPCIEQEKQIEKRRGRHKELGKKMCTPRHVKGWFRKASYEKHLRGIMGNTTARLDFTLHRSEWWLHVTKTFGLNMS